MSTLDSTITIAPEYRTCIICGEKKALFHKWVEESYVKNAILKGECGGTVKTTFALIEYEDGTMAKIDPWNVMFTDGKVKQIHAENVTEENIKEGNKQP